ncbi:MAG: acyltransferase [Alcanivoracaceae bacterium]|nr:acyltransferase [Alcanivoracaceae bacterium]
MFGILRTTLALMVMIFHIFIGYLPLGTYAVFGFFIISGYLMTLIMHKSYGYTRVGRVSFIINRFLRLHPLYWLASILTIALIYYLGSEMVHNFHKSMDLPSNNTSIVQNIFMVFPAWIPGSIHPRLVPPTWAITVEMFYYVLICFGVSKTFTRVKIWIVLSIAYVLYTFFYGLPWNSRYFHILAASLPFAIGACIYFISTKSKYQKLFNGLGLSSKILYISMLINCTIWILIPKTLIGSFNEIGFYMNIIICSLLVYSIATGGKIINLSKKYDKYIGDYSYPIYLLHLQGGLLASYLIFGDARVFHHLTVSSAINFSLAIIIVFVLSTFCILIIDKPIQKIRSRIKKSMIR